MNGTSGSFTASAFLISNKFFVSVKVLVIASLGD